MLFFKLRELTHRQFVIVSCFCLNILHMQHTVARMIKVIDPLLKSGQLLKLTYDQDLPTQENKSIIHIACVIYPSAYCIVSERESA